MSMGNDQTYLTEEEQFAAANAEAGQSDTQQQAQTTPPEADEPFEGFNALPPAAQEKFREHLSKADTLAQELAQQRRQYGALAGRLPGLQRQLDEYKRTAAAPSSAKPQTPAQAAAWDAFKAQFPEDAKAIEERQALLAAEFGGKLDPLERQNKELLTRLERIEQQAQAAENAEIQETLSEHVPDWKILAGWETPDGQEGDHNWHPEFQAWLDSLPPRVRGNYEEGLGSRDPSDVVFVMNAFKRDYILALQDEEEAGGYQPTLQQSRRQQALNDVTPSGGGRNLAAQPNRSGMHVSEEDRYAAAVDQWRDKFGWARQG